MDFIFAKSNSLSSLEFSKLIFYKKSVCWYILRSLAFCVFNLGMHPVILNLEVMFDLVALSSLHVLIVGPESLVDL